MALHNQAVTRAQSVLQECGSMIFSFLRCRAFATAAVVDKKKPTKNPQLASPPKLMSALHSQTSVARTYVPISRSTGKNRLWNSHSPLAVFENPDAEVAYMALRLLRKQRNFTCKPETLVRDLIHQWEGDPALAPKGTRVFEHFPELFDVRYHVFSKYEPLFGGPSAAQDMILQWTTLAKQQMLGDFERAVVQGAVGSANDASLPQGVPLPSSTRANVASKGIRAVRFVLTDAVHAHIRSIAPEAIPAHHPPRILRTMTVTLTPAALRYYPRLDYSDEQLHNVWGQVLTTLFSTCGPLSSPVIDVFLQKYAIQHNLPLPPTGAAWFLMSRHPAFSFCRPVWQENEEKYVKRGAIKMSGVIIGAKISDDRLTGKLKVSTTPDQLLDTLMQRKVYPNLRPSQFLPPPVFFNTSAKIDLADLEAVAASLRVQQPVSAATASEGKPTAALGAFPSAPAPPVLSPGSSTPDNLWTDASAQLPSFRLTCPHGAQCTDQNCTYGHRSGRVSTSQSVGMDAALDVQRQRIQTGELLVTQTVDWAALLDDDSLAIRDAEGQAVAGYSCIHGMECVNDNCDRTHPPGWSPELARTVYMKAKRATKPCIAGMNCAQAECQYRHPEGWDPVQALKALRGSRPCNFGISCINAQCQYQHPEGWAPRQQRAPNTKAVPCRHAERCNNPNCKFDHPPNWDPEARLAQRAVWAGLRGGSAAGQQEGVRRKLPLEDEVGVPTQPRQQAQRRTKGTRAV